MMAAIIENYNGGPVGLETLAATIGEESVTLEDVYEPYLMQLGFLTRTPRGRCVTRKAYEHLHIAFLGQEQLEDIRSRRNLLWARLFGTDGIRGIVGENSHRRTGYFCGAGSAAVLTEEKGSKPPLPSARTPVLLGYAGGGADGGHLLCGGDVMPLGTIPTPAVAYLDVLEQADVGIVISASHNPYEHNGIKVFKHRAISFLTIVRARVEELLLSAHPGSQDPRPRSASASRDAADEVGLHRPSDFQHRPAPVGPAGWLVNCANGAALPLRPDLFERPCPCTQIFIHREPTA